MSLPNGAYVVFGQFLSNGDAPQVHLLAEPALSFFRAQLESVQVSDVLKRRLMAATFNMLHADSVIPAWSVDAMSLIAQHYSGQHETELRGLCAAIALGRPFGQDAKGKSDDSDGGVKVKNPQPKPRKPPGGAFAALTTTGVTTNAGA